MEINNFIMLRIIAGEAKPTPGIHTHRLLTKVSGETGLAMIGPDTTTSRETDSNEQVYSNQLPATIAGLLGENFESIHPVGKPLNLPAFSIDKSVVVKNR
jgi:hypothetical protein